MRCQVTQHLICVQTVSPIDYTIKILINILLWEITDGMIYIWYIIWGLKVKWSYCFLRWFRWDIWTLDISHVGRFMNVLSPYSYMLNSFIAATLSYITGYWSSHRQKFCHTGYFYSSFCCWLSLQQFESFCVISYVDTYSWPMTFFLDWFYDNNIIFTGVGEDTTSSGPSSAKSSPASSKYCFYLHIHVYIFQCKYIYFESQ